MVYLPKEPIPVLNGPDVGYLFVLVPNDANHYGTVAASGGVALR